LESGAVSWLAGFDATQPLWWFGDAVVDRGDAEQSARVEDGSDRLRRGHIDRPTRLRVSAHLGGVLTLVRADRQVFHTAGLVKNSSVPPSTILTVLSVRAVSWLAGFDATQPLGGPVMPS
jgi:hypothetical protein